MSADANFAIRANWDSDVRRPKAKKCSPTNSADRRIYPPVIFWNEKLAMVMFIMTMAAVSVI